ncbi:MAG: hypothetical protein WB919_06860, partial [Candidatus Sulfotelmatobacter sp.]
FKAVYGRNGMEPENSLAAGLAFSASREKQMSERISAGKPLGFMFVRDKKSFTVTRQLSDDKVTLCKARFTQNRLTVILRQRSSIPKIASTIKEQKDSNK